MNAQRAKCDQTSRAARAAAALLLFLLCAASLVAQEKASAAESAKPEQAAKPEYVGSETCQACHEDIFTAFKKTNRHAVLETEKRRGWETKACEACHGPGSKHAESTEKADIRNPAKLSPGQTERTCLTCHTNQPTQVGRVFNGHGRNQVGCASCHKVHAVQAKNQPRVTRLNAECSTCHKAERAAFMRPHAHAVNQGVVACVDCHNPHGSMLPKAISMAIGGEPGCLKCHSDKRGPFAYEHPPMRLQGCTACHEPHGSANPRMLTRPRVPQMCLECHANIALPNGGTRSGALATTPPALHDLRNVRFQNCTICHQKIHGSHIDRRLLR